MSDSKAKKQAKELMDSSGYPKLEDVVEHEFEELPEGRKRRYPVTPAVREQRKEARRSAVAKQMGQLVREGKDDSLSPNLKALAMNMLLLNLPQIDYKDGAAVWARTCQYFEMCSTMDEKPSVEGYALALGVDRRKLTKWLDGEAEVPEDTIKAISKGYQLLGAQMSSFMLNGKINPIAGIFLMRNNLGYTNVDKVEEEKKPEEDTAPVDADEMIRRFKDLPD